MMTLALRFAPDEGGGTNDGHAIVVLWETVGNGRSEHLFHLPTGDATAFARSFFGDKGIGGMFADFIEERCPEVVRDRTMAVHLLHILRNFEQHQKELHAAILRERYERGELLGPLTDRYGASAVVAALGSKHIASSLGVGDDDDGPVFTHCNVCGIRLRTEEEDQMGMCERCADE